MILNSQTSDNISAQRIAVVLGSIKPAIATAVCEWKRITLAEAPDFRVVSILRPDENRLSAVIAELLNPQGTHGQGFKFLQLLVRQLPSLKAGDLDNALVRLECCTYTIARQQRRIDILVEGKNPPWGVGIENKPWAGEQHDQLSDYTAELKNRFGANFVLLRLAGGDGDPTSLGQEAHKQLSAQGKFCTWRYYSELTEWLYSCHSHCGAPNVARFIEELIHYIEAEFGNPPMTSHRTMEEKHLLPALEAALADAEEDIRAAAAVAEVFPMLRQKWVVELFVEVEKQVQRRLGAGWSVHRNSEPFVESDWAKFVVWHEDWGNVYRICLESQPKLRRVVLGIWREPKPGLQRNVQVRSELRRLGWGDETGGPWWEGISALPQPFTDWTSSATIALVRSQRAELEKIIVRGIVDIGTALKETLAVLTRDFEQRTRS